MFMYMKGFDSSWFVGNVYVCTVVIDLFYHGTLKLSKANIPYSSKRHFAGHRLFSPSIYIFKSKLKVSNQFCFYYKGFLTH